MARKERCGVLFFAYVAVFYIRFVHKQERVQSPLAILVTSSICPVQSNVTTPPPP